MFTCVSIIIGVLSLVVTLGLWYMESRPAENEDLVISMAASAAENRESYSKENHSAFVVGYTGEVGKELVKEILTSKIVRRLVLVGRREVKFEDDLYKDVEQTVVDFDKLDDFAEAFKGFDVGFCCLGTTRKKSGADGFYKVDHDYVMATAKLAKEGGCKHFHLVSSQGSDKNSMFLYTKTKGQVEEEMKEIGFDRLSIYRPGVLMCDREEKRFGEAFFKTLLKPVAAAFPTSISTPTTTVAKAMVNCAVSEQPRDKNWELYENKAIHQLAGEVDAHGKKVKKPPAEAAATSD